jgi:hypothetical protein
VQGRLVFLQNFAPRHVKGILAAIPCAIAGDGVLGCARLQWP